MAITTIGTNGIADNVITGAKVALASQAAGDVMYYNGTDWIRVAIGTDGQVLTVNNAENAPGWEAASGGIASVAADTSPQLGGSLDAQNNTILNVGNANSDWTAGTLSIATSGGVFLNMDTYSTTANEASNINLRRSKNATLGSFSQVVANDSMGTINFQGSTSSGFTGGPTISGISTESRTSSAGGSKLEIKTIANSSTTPVLAMTIDQDGAVTMPKQPAFLASDRTDTANQTGDGTWYIEIFSGEIFDQNGDYDSVSTFTAPVTGRYHLSSTMACGGVTSSHTSGNLAIMVSNHVNETFFHPWNNWAANEYGASIVGTFLVDMDASDTAYVRVKVQNGAKTVDFNDTGASGTHSSFSGFLVA